MMIWRRGKVCGYGKSWSSALELQVVLTAATGANAADEREAPTGAADIGKTVTALAYLPLVGQPKIGDSVLLSAAAVKRGLGTGGYLFVVANESALPADPPPRPGHLVKARYTPSQFLVQGVDEQESPYHEILAQADGLTQMPVVCTDLHSALPAIALGISAMQAQLPQPLRIAYIMHDGAALPVWFSQLAAKLKEMGLIYGTISCGQAFGGDLEAVNIYTALLAAKHVWHADIAIVTQGPGNLGTGTKWGFSGTQIGEALNAVGILGGQAISALRLSNADARTRHYGISHHTLRILQDIVHVPCEIAVPDYRALVALEKADDILPHGFTAHLTTQLAPLAAKTNLQFTHVDFTHLLPYLEQQQHLLRTMGRSYREDASAFIAGAAAGKLAALRNETL